LNAGNVATAIVDQLAVWGVRTVYGVAGDTILELMHALGTHQQVEFITTRHEEAAALMASAQAKITGKLGVCIATSGPGVAHLINGLADAFRDRVPVLALTGQVETKFLGTEKKQYVDQQELVRPVVNYTTLAVSPDSVIEVVARAMRIAIGERRVTHVSIPKDIFPLPFTGTMVGPGPYLGTTPRSGEEVLAGAQDKLNRAQRPVIVAGAGSREASQPVLELAEKWQAGVITTIPAKGVIPEDHPLALGGLGEGGSEAATEALKQADLVLAAGVNWWPSAYVPSNPNMIQVDINPVNIGGKQPVDFGVVGDVRDVLPRFTSLLTHFPKPEWGQVIADARRRWFDRVKQEASPGGFPVAPAALMAALGRNADPDAIFSLDVGDHVLWFNRVFEAKRQRVLVSGKWRTMGFGLPAALAAKICRPDLQVIAVVGDGGMGMVLGEFTTAVRYGLPVTVVVVNNGYLAMERNRQKVANLALIGTDLTNPDWAEFARICGGAGYKVEAAEQLDQVLTEAIACGKPSLVDVATSDTILPTTTV